MDFSGLLMNVKGAKHWYQMSPGASEEAMGRETASCKGMSSTAQKQAAQALVTMVMFDENPKSHSSESGVNA